MTSSLLELLSFRHPPEGWTLPAVRQAIERGGLVVIANERDDRDRTLLMALLDGLGHGFDDPSLMGGARRREVLALGRLLVERGVDQDAVDANGRMASHRGWMGVAASPPGPCVEVSTLMGWTSLSPGAVRERVQSSGVHAETPTSAGVPAGVALAFAVARRMGGAFKPALERRALAMMQALVEHAPVKTGGLSGNDFATSTALAISGSMHEWDMDGDALNEMAKDIERLCEAGLCRPYGASAGDKAELVGRMIHQKHLLPGGTRQFFSSWLLDCAVGMVLSIEQPSEVGPASRQVMTETAWDALWESYRSWPDEQPGPVRVGRQVIESVGMALREILRHDSHLPLPTHMSWRAWPLLLAMATRLDLNSQAKFGQSIIPAGMIGARQCQALFDVGFPSTFPHQEALLREVAWRPFGAAVMARMRQAELAGLPGGERVRERKRM